MDIKTPVSGYVSLNTVGFKPEGKVVKNTEERYSHGWFNGKIEVYQWIQPMTGKWSNPALSISGTTVSIETSDMYFECLKSAVSVMGKLSRRVGQIGSILNE